MNCKQGDRALVIRGLHSYGFEGNHTLCTNTLVGAVTRCIELVENFVPAWRIDPLQCITCGRELPYSWDSVLKPLPDPDDVRAFDEEREIEHV